MNLEANTRRRSRGLTLCALAVLASLAVGPSSAGAAARPLNTGVSYVYVLDTETAGEAAAAFQHVRETGATSTLTPLEWGRVVPDKRPAAWNPEDPGDPHYQWELYDIWVRGAVAAGLTPVLQVRGAPLWAQRCGSGSIDTPCDLNPADLAAFTTAAVRRYSGQFGGLPRVQYWQGLNEPNLSLFFLPQFDGSGRAVSAELYRTLINAFYGAVKAVDPSNLVIAGGLGPIAVPKYTVGPMRFTRELLCMRGKTRFRPLPGDCGGGVHFDIYDIHPYTTGSPAHEGGPNDVQLGDLPKLVALLRAADRAGRIEGAFARTPLWVSELSWDSNPPDPGGLSMPILSRWAAEALFTAWRAGVDTFMWYSLRDGKDYPDTPSYLEPQSGLFFRGATVAQDEPKPVLHAYRFPFVAYPRKKGLFFWGRTPSGKGGRVVIQVRKRGDGWRRVAAVRADRYGIFQGVADSGYGRNKRGFARAHYANGSSVAFSMRPVPDFRQPPFGAETSAG
jgi:hypothetical protein